VALVRTDISEKCIASNISVTRIVEEGTLGVTLMIEVILVRP
jgi:hypothetical protein